MIKTQIPGTTSAVVVDPNKSMPILWDSLNTIGQLMGQTPEEIEQDFLEILQEAPDSEQHQQSS